MKIVYLIHQFYPEFYTGTEKFVFNLSTMMQKAGNKVKVISYSFYEEELYSYSRGNLLCKEYIYKGVPVLAIRHKKTPDDLHEAFDNKALSEIATDLITKEKPDIVHIGHPMRVAALAQVLPSLSIPYIVTLTDFFLVCPKVNLVTSENALCAGPENGGACRKMCPELPSDYVARRLKAAKEILFSANLIVAPSRFLAGIFKREFRELEVKIISHGLNFNQLKPNEKRYTRDDRVVFCYAGSFNPHKGTHVLIEAFRRLNRSNALLKIYGSGPEESYVKSLTSMAATNGNIEFCGVYPESQTGEVLSNVDVVVVPSLCYENYPMTLHEAL